MIKILLLLFTITINTAYTAEVGPKIEFEYAYIFDLMCAQNSKIKINPKLSQGAMNSNKRFQKYWDESASGLLTSLYKVIGKRFYRKELTLYTTVCNYVPMSQPFLLNVKYWVNVKNDIAKRSLVQMTFHEFLHKYLLSVFDWRKSKMLKTVYQKESFNIQAHLHLLALEIAIFKEAKRPDLIRTSEYNYTKLIKGDYLKTWNIVKKIGYKKILRDLKESLK